MQVIACSFIVMYEQEYCQCVQRHQHSVLLKTCRAPMLVFLSIDNQLEAEQHLCGHGLPLVMPALAGVVLINSVLLKLHLAIKFAFSTPLICHITKMATCRMKVIAQQVAFARYCASNEVCSPILHILALGLPWPSRIPTRDHPAGPTLRMPSCFSSGRKRIPCLWSA